MQFEKNILTTLYRNFENLSIDFFKKK